MTFWPQRPVERRGAPGPHPQNLPEQGEPGLEVLPPLLGEVVVEPRPKDEKEEGGEEEEG